MTLKYYGAYLTIAQTPQEEFNAELQALVDEQFESASNVYTIEEESSFGSMTFADTIVRINHEVNSSTGEKLGEDFKKITFKDRTHNVALGKRYRFDDNIWIAVNVDSYASDYSLSIRRCNNTLNWYVSATPSTPHYEPCIIEYIINQTEFEYNKYITLAKGDIAVICQYNDYTSGIEIDDRFIFGNHGWRVRAMNNYLRSTTFDETSVPLLYLALRVDQVNDTIDDLTNDVVVNPVSATPASGQYW